MEMSAWAGKIRPPEHRGCLFRASRIAPRGGMSTPSAMLRRRMAASAPIYDLVALLDPTVDHDVRETLLAEIEQQIIAQGELVSAQDWGVRELAFEIDDAKQASYHLIQFKGPVPLLEEIDRQLKIADPVTRFRIIKNGTNMPEPVAPGAPVAGTADRSDRDRDR